jgi:hypothetical protein
MKRILTLSGMILAISTSGAFAEDATEKMARQLQDPLANIKAVMSDNDVLFKTSG